MSDEHKRVRAMGFQSGTVYTFSVPRVTARMVAASVGLPMFIEATELLWPKAASCVVLKEVVGYAPIYPRTAPQQRTAWFGRRFIAGYNFRPEAMLINAAWIGVSLHPTNDSFHKAEWTHGSHMAFNFGDRFANCLYIQTPENVGGKQIKFVPLPITLM